MNESCHIWMSHVTYGSVTAHTNESWHRLTSVFTYNWVMTHMWFKRQLTFKWVISHMNESCRTSEWLVSPIYWWVMSHIWMSRFWSEWVISRLNQLCHTWMSHGTEWISSRAVRKAISFSTTASFADVKSVCERERMCVEVSLCLCLWLCVYYVRAYSTHTTASFAGREICVWERARVCGSKFVFEFVVACALCMVAHSTRENT